MSVNRIYWPPFILQDIILSLVILAAVAIEWSYRERYIKLWKQQYYLLGLFNKLETQELYNQERTRMHRGSLNENDAIYNVEKILKQE